MSPLRLRPDCSFDGVTILEKDVDDMDGGEAVRASDEDFTSWGYGWHGLLLFEIGVSVR